MPPIKAGIGVDIMRRVVMSFGGSAPPALVLDSLSAGAAYSTRKLRTAYAGAAIRVRRSSDNLEADIGFSGNALDTTALTAHVGANSGFVVTWYDQSTNARHVTNAIAGQQPRIVNAGTIELQNSKPALYFDNALSSRLFNSSPFMYAAGAATIISVFRAAGQLNRTIFAERSSLATVPMYRYEFTTTGGNNLATRIRNDANTLITAGTSIIIGEIDDTLRNYALRDTGSELQPYVNGTAETPLAYTRSGVLTLNLFSIGANPTAASIEAFTGFMSEAIFFDSAISNADLNAVNASQGGEYGISVSPFLTPVERLGLINGTGDGGSSFAVGLGGIPDWEEPRFLDRAKSARGWQTQAGATYPSGNLNSEGALASLNGTDTEARFFFSSFRDGNGAHVSPQPDLSGRFRVTITGAASSMTGFGVTGITQINATTWEFDCDMIGNKWLTFTPTAFPVKAAIVRTTDIAAHDAGGIFRQEFLDFLPSGGCFRFMDWMGTNNSPIVNWSDYPVRASQSWRRVPFEVMVALCNAKSATPWFCMPHACSADFATQAATYVFNNLNPGLKVRIEKSNETWNFLFTQASWFLDRANTEWPTEAAGNRWQAQAGKLFVRDMQAWRTVWAGQESRLIGVIAGQAAGTSLSAEILNATAWQRNEPGTYIAPHTLAKEFSIADYIGWVNATSQAPAVATAVQSGHAAGVAAVKALIAPGLALSKQYIDNNASLAAVNNLRLTTYEYNNHLDLNAASATTLYSGGNPIAGALDAFVEATYSQEMADAQDELRTYWKAQNGALKTLFVDMNRASRFGTWGAKTHFSHNSLIWNDLLSWHTANTRWWAQ